MNYTEYDVYYYMIDEDLKDILTAEFPELAQQFSYQYPDSSYYEGKWFIPEGVVVDNPEIYGLLVSYQQVEYIGFMWSHHPSFVG